MKIPLKTSLLLAAAAFAFTAQAHEGEAHDASIGESGDAAKATRTVEVDMTDNMRFTPSSIDAKQGETIRFVVKNSGQLKHEFVLGTYKALKQHAELMKKFPEMEHSDPNQVTVQPGKTGEVVWHFTKAGKVQFACLQPGHYDAGMKGQVQVVAAKGARATETNAGAASSSGSRATASPTPTGGASETAWIDGEVKKVDKETGKVTLKHGEIRNLGMPGMTMVFKVKDLAVLDALHPGEKVRFAAEKAGGSIVVTQIEAAK